MRSDRFEFALLAEIRDCIRLIESYIHGMELTDFHADTMRRDATAFRLLMIGEAASHLPESVKTRLPQVDWRGMVSLRHRLAHDYPSADTRILWAVATGDVPALTKALDSL
ncbi:DUF86 domain-containing protein [Brevundimonas basaltis]|uniref:Uncharacterized protein with HEPN domain n=1 Tax=Brevundimonas basaltis TaxID=472166 RepID=A0A7W8HZC0_9CAUL|nr:DUF86 domain-containing protein [Brevundimonas basaltis]MBB5292580.1 uncharacterized protein with HEPN domain [Brevundimonas basaltis]